MDKHPQSTSSAKRVPGAISALVAVRNEERNIARCLEALSFCDEVIVLDSHSTDATVAIAESCGAKVVPFTYQGGYPKKRQWALDEGLASSEWILLIDADEVVSPELAAELVRIAQSKTNHSAFLCRKTFHFQGQRFQFGGFSHRAVNFFRNGSARFEQTVVDPPKQQDMEVHERVIVDGTVGLLHGLLIHDDFKDLEAYIARHNYYSTWEARLRAQHLRTGLWGSESIRASPFGDSQERRRWLKSIVIRIPVEPLCWFSYHYFLRLGFLEGKAGFLAARLRANYIADVRAKLRELRMVPRQPAGNARLRFASPASES